MMKDFLDFLSALIPFLRPYPGWVKILIAFWIVLAAIIAISLIFARPDAEQKNKQQEFFNNLDKGKRAADNQLESIAAGDVNTLRRLRLINDYVFKTYKKIYLNQIKWFNKNGRYFQGRKTTSKVPKYQKPEKLILGPGLSDQVDNWSEFGMLDDDSAPVQITCDVYEGPNGHGYVLTAKFSIENQIWQNQMHIGNESNNITNFQWRN